MPARNLPRPVPGPVTAGYGWRTLPNGLRNFHNGIDLAWLYRDPVGSRRVLAPLDGVALVGVNALAGNFVSLPIGDGYSTRFAHLESVAVKTGQGVRRGDLLGVMGATGSQVFGVHLHVDVFAPDGTRVDPELYYGDAYVGTLAPASGGVAPILIDESEHVEMKLIRTPDGTVSLVTPSAVVPITAASHLTILVRVLKSSPGEWVSLTAAEADVVRAYVAKANAAGGSSEAVADLKPVLDAIKTLPAATVAALKAAL